MKAKLVVVGGEAKTPEVELKLPAILGRGREATLTLPHPLVSRQHCEIFESNGQLMVRDLGSLNGTFVANERVTESLLEHGQLLTVGTVTFRAMHLEENGQVVGEAASAPVAAPASADETVPVPETLDLEAAGAGPPMALPLDALPSEDATAPTPEPSAPGPAPSAAPEAPGAETPADDEDDMSSFFDSLK